MKKALILGGTRFFGKRLAGRLEKEGYEVTLATRGKTDTSFLNKGRHIKVDRFNRRSMEKAFRSEWDLVYDQICFSPADAADAVDVFEGKAGHYIFTSTLSVYDMNEKAEKKEEDFHPWDHPIYSGRKESFSYGEGKRGAEAVFFQKASFPVTAVRPPVVLGEDDYTERLHYHIRRVAEGKSVGIDNPEAEVSFVDSDDLASFLLWCGENKVEGPYNASAPDTISLGEMIRMIERTVDKKAELKSSNKVSASPLNFPVSYYQNTDKAAAAGYHFSPLSEWLQPLMEKIYKQEYM